MRGDLQAPNADGAVQFFDLTRPLVRGMPVEPGDPPVVLTTACTHAADGYQVTEIRLGSHSGTHVDTPRHFFRDGQALDQYPVERLVAPAVVVDCRVERTRGSDVGRQGDPSSMIDAPMLQQRLAHDEVPSGGFVLLWTEGAFLTLGAARLLLDRGATLVGTDAPSLDEDPYPVHRLLLGAGLLLAENLTGLDRLGPGVVMCACLPLPLSEGDGAPARIVAWR